jgi:hypothetical protein
MELTSPLRLRKGEVNYRSSQNKFTTLTVSFYQSLNFNGIDVFAFGQVFVHLFDEPCELLAALAASSSRVSMRDKYGIAHINMPAFFYVVFA